MDVKYYFLEFALKTKNIRRCKLQYIYRFINVKAGRPILPGIGTNSLGSKFRTGTNCLGNFGRPEHLAAGHSFVCLLASSLKSKMLVNGFIK
jgi:hypothetical protein